MLAGCQAPPAARFSQKGQQDYYVQHRLLPELILAKDRVILEMIKTNRSLDFMEESLDGQKYDWRQVTVTVAETQAVEGYEVLYLQFPKPYATPLCYYVAIVDDGRHARYITLEMAMPGMGGIKAFLCEWIDGGAARVNYGPMTSIGLAAFASRVDALIRQQMEPVTIARP
jgi:hypothetical protein